MTPCCSKASYFDVLTTSKPLLTFRNSTIQLVYEVAAAVFRMGVYAALTYAAPLGSFLLSAVTYGAAFYHQFNQEGKIKSLMADSSIDQTKRNSMLEAADSVRSVNRLQREFELVNLVALAAFDYLSIPLFLIWSGMSVWSWWDSYHAETSLRQKIMSHQPNIGSLRPGN